MWLVLSRSISMSSTCALRLLNSNFKAWSSIVYCTTTCQTSSTNFSIVGPATTKPIILYICWRDFNFLWTFYDICLASSAHGWVLAKIIDVFRHNSSIWVYMVFPSWSLENLCTIAKVCDVTLISSNYSCFLEMSTSILCRYGSSCIEIHISIVLSKI